MLQLNPIDKIFNPTFVGQGFIRTVTHKVNREIRRLHAEAEKNIPLSDSPYAGFGGAKLALARRLPIELIYISDNGHTGATEQPVPDQATAEIEGRLNTIERAFEILSGQKPNIKIRYQDVASQDVLGGAAALYQSVVGELPVFGRVVFLNVAPRKKESGKKKKNGGEKVYVGLHSNGTLFFGTGPHCFSLFRKEIESGDLKIFRSKVAVSGSQFRSRDFFPWDAYLAALNLHKFAGHAGRRISPAQQEKYLSQLNFVNTEEALPAKKVPEVPNDNAAVTSIDVHGNLKTALRGRDLSEAYPEGGSVYVLANGKLFKAVIATNSFDKSPGTIALSRGSTYRDPLKLGKSDPAAVEVFKVGDRVADDFEVGAPHLRRGLEFHVFDAALFHKALTAKGISLQFPADKTRTVNEMPSAWADVAGELAQRGFVKGLNNNVLRHAVENRTLNFDGGAVHALRATGARLDA